MEEFMTEEIITINLPLTLGMGSVNCYLVKTKGGMILIDSGGSNARGKLVKALEEAGCEPGSLRLIILTHGDFDHSGNAAFIKQIFGGEIGMHSADTGMIEQGDMFVNRGQMSMFMRRLISIFFGLKKSERFTPDHLFQEGDEIINFGLSATIITLPGHSKGSIGVLMDNRDLLCGDMLVNSRTPEVNTLIDDPTVMAASLDKLSGMDIQTVYPGHGKPFQMRDLLQGLAK
jgi:hydroxyacylglutathione hydrolase